MKYHVYRVQIGRGLVDYCGDVEATSMTEAEMVARLMHPFHHGLERLDVELDELESLEASMARYDEMDPSEVDSEEYTGILARIVKLREELA